MNPNRHRNIIPIIVMTAALLLQGCGNEPKRNDTEQAATIATAEITENLQDSEIPERPDNSENLENSENTENSGNQENDWQIRKLVEMTLEQKVAQMFMPTLEQLTEGGIVTEADDTVRQAFEQYPVGGIICFGENVIDPQQITELTTKLNEYSLEAVEMPLFLGTDEEGGRVTRFANNPNFSVEAITDMAEIGAAGNKESAYHAGSVIGAYLRQYGFNVDFAPVVDVVTNPDNQVIGRRSFGSDAGLVSELSSEVVKGLQEQGVYACIKHFPGHGTTSADTHTGAVYTDRTLEELKEFELVPFAEQIKSGISFIMVSHISAPKVTGNEEPASVSKTMITDVLRQELGYEGIVITDAMNMGAITGQYKSGEAAVKAFAAGADIVLMPENFKEAYQGVLDAVAEGTLTEQRIDESVCRILEIKRKISCRNDTDKL